MTNVTNIRHAIPMRAETSKTLIDLSSAIVKAIDASKGAGLPQGLIVAALHGHAQVQTNIMVC